MQRALVLIFGITISLGVAAGAAAQDATPPGAAACTIQPYDLTTVLEPTEGTPVAVPSPEPTPAERPTGEPAGEDIEAAVIETIEQFVTCYNEGYQFKIVFLFTPDYLRRFIAENVGPLTAEEIAQVNALAANEQPEAPLPENEQTIIVAIEDVEVLEDGRVVATVIGDDLSEPEGPNPIYFLFAEVDGRYLIDGVIAPQPDATPAP